MPKSWMRPETVTCVWPAIALLQLPDGVDAEPLKTLQIALSADALTVS